MSRPRRSLRSGEATAAQMSYQQVKFIVESQLPPGILEIWKEKLMTDVRIEKCGEMSNQLGSLE